MRYAWPISILLFLQCGAPSTEPTKNAASSAGIVAPAVSLPQSAKIETKPLQPEDDKPAPVIPRSELDLRSLFQAAYRAFQADKETSAPLFQAAAQASGKRPEKVSPGALSEDFVSMSEDHRLMLVSEDKSACLIAVGSGEVLGFYARQGTFDAKDLLSPGGDAIAGLDVEPGANTFDLVIRKIPGFDETSRTTIGRSGPIAFLGRDRVVTARRSDGEIRDELIVLSLLEGKVETILKTQGPHTESNPLSSSTEEQRIRLPAESLVTTTDVVGTIWEDKSVSLHRVSSGRLIGLFDSSLAPFQSTTRIVFNDNPQRAAISCAAKARSDDELPLGQTALVDLATDRTIRLMTNCPYVADLAFSKDGKTLAVGDLLKVCFHDAKTGRFLKKSGKVRQPYAPDDDLQNVTVRELENGRWSVMSADGSLGIVHARTGDFQRLGRAAGIYIAEGDTLIAGIDTDELLVVKKGRVSKRPMTEEESANPFGMPPEAAGTKAEAKSEALRKAGNALCVLDGYFLPSSHCK